MKGKSTFTRSEADAIIALIRQKLQANSAEQKSIRDKIRKIGFYASDFGFGGGYNEFDFLRVVTITGGKQQIVSERPKLTDKVQVQVKKEISPINKQIAGLAPVSDRNSKILILGTMPGEESLRKQEYYGNQRNLFWKIIAEITGEPAPLVYEDKKQYLLRHKIALWDMCALCVRPGSLDSNISDEEPNDIRGFVARHPNIKTIACNGDKAYKMFQKYVGEMRYIRILNLPSTSPANAGVKWEVKVERWREILNSKLIK
jgi:hypoxanthine-DNA glycosylase